MLNAKVPTDANMHMIEVATAIEWLVMISLHAMQACMLQAAYSTQSA